MAIERTFAIIKPDAVASDQQGEILSRIHKAGFKIVAIKSLGVMGGVLGSSAFAEDSPTTCPILRPPPAKASVHRGPQ